MWFDGKIRFSSETEMDSVYLLTFPVMKNEINTRKFSWNRFHQKIYKYYILTARIKKSSCIHETQPKFEYLNMRSIIHITRSAKRDLAVNSVMHKGTSAVDWWFGMNKILSSDTCSKGTRSPDSTTLYPAGK